MNQNLWGNKRPSNKINKVVFYISFISKKASENKAPVTRPREIPSILQGEVAALNKKFVARLDKSQSNTSGDVHIIVSISDLDLPPVKELK